VGADSDWASVSAGWVHTCASRLDGSAWCWGNNAHGQLGDGSLTSVFEPSRVARARTWLDIEAGGWNTCGVQGDGSAWCWGRNSSGEVGDGTTISRRFPTRVGQDVHWVSLQPSWTHTCGLRADGAVRCWGGNEGGQLGSASGPQSVVPRTVAGDHIWSSVSTGAGFTCATDTDLAVWCWGTGRYGQLGAATSRSDVPMRVTSVGTGTGLDLGWLHACVSGATGRPQCWGSNETGQLGDRTTSDRSGIEAAVPEPTTSSASRRAATGFDFNLVTMNVLGSNHTAPGSNSSEFSPARIRSEWMVDYLASRNASVVGFQEIQRDQLAWFVRGAGSEYAVWPGTQIGPAGVQTTIAWKKSTWRLLETDYVEIPFITQRRLMPLVRLEHRATGRAVWVMNVHNAPQDWQAQRNTAVETEIRRLKRVIGQGDPVFLIGDFNERHRVFCEVTGRLDFVAPRGGSNVDGTCKPPSGLNRVDWIFGSDDVRYSGYAEDRSTLVGRITDHAVLRTRVSVP
jgi:alpha-tubulin suppressor-like RCC1 family protein/endonuclease/exonuclease/phosphatase family metal-dependent hydrolase